MNQLSAVQSQPSQRRTKAWGITLESRAQHQGRHQRPSGDKGRSLRGRRARAQITSHRRAATQLSQLAHTPGYCWFTWKESVATKHFSRLWSDLAAYIQFENIPYKSLLWTWSRWARTSLQYFHCLTLTPCLHYMTFEEQSYFAYLLKTVIFCLNFNFHSASKIIKSQCCRQPSNRNLDTLL